MFKKKKKLIDDRPVKFPVWTFVELRSKYYLLLNETMLEFISTRAFESWNVTAIKVNDTMLSKYNVWKKVGFALGSKVMTIDGKKYVMSGTNPIEAKACRVATPDFFNIGYKDTDFVCISDIELQFHEKGDDIIAV